MARMAQTSQRVGGNAPTAPMASMAPHALMGGGAIPARVRESSAPADGNKKRKLQLGPLPSSNLARGASTGPGTPKAGTPGSRAGSLGPRTKKATVKKVAGGGPEHPLRKKMNKSGLSKKQARRLKAGHRASPSTTGDDGSDASGSEEDDVSVSQVDGGEEDEEMADDGYEEEADTTPYCVCRNPSHGDMIACDNKKCKFEWFHYECVGLDREPKGKWLCPQCRELPPNMVKFDKSVLAK